MRSTRFLVVITGHDVGPYAEPLVRSLAEQTFPHWRAIFVDDASTDGTPRDLEQALAAHDLRERVTIVRNPARVYKACNVYRVLKEMAHDDEAVALLDGDDRLGDPRALALFDREYQQGWDVVWSNWVGSDGSPGKSDYLSPLVSPRRQPFVTEHLFSFRKRLFDAVSDSDLKDDQGQWFRSGCDAAIAWPVLEQTLRRRFVNRALYVYNVANPASHKASGGKREQIRTLSALRGRPRRRPPLDLHFVCRHAGHFLQAALMNARLVPRYLRHERRIRHSAARGPSAG